MRASTACTSRNCSESAAAPGTVRRSHVSPPFVVRSTAAAWPLTHATRALDALTAWSNAAVPLA
jgi:hypothetical protein